MRTIWKFLVSMDTRDHRFPGAPYKTTLLMPKGSIPRFAGIDPKNDELHVWAEVETSKERVERRVYVFGTGQMIWMRDHDSYIGTVVRNDGFVWHVFIEDE